MEWFENEELALVIDTMKTFSAREIEGKVVDLERLEKPEFPRAAIETLSDLGFLWGPAPEDIGSGMNEITTVVILSKLAETCAGFAAIVACHYAAVDSIAAVPGGFETLRGLCAGNGKQPLLGVCLKDEIGPRDGSGKMNDYIAIPAPDSVDRAVLFLTPASPTLSPASPTLSPASQAGTTMALTPASPTLSPASQAGTTVRTNLSGCDEMPTARLRLPDAVLEGFEVIASGPDAQKARVVLTSSLKLYFSAIMQGAARSATAYALGYAKERHQTGRAIVHHQDVYKKLVEMEIKNQSMASFLYRAACNGSGGGVFGLEDMLFAFTKAESEHVVNEAIQNLGGYGYMREYGLEKKLRDIKTLQALLPTRDSFPVA